MHYRRSNHWWLDRRTFCWEHSKKSSDPSVSSNWGWYAAGGVAVGAAAGGLAGWGVGSAITAFGATATGAAGTAATPVVDKVAQKATTALQTYYPPNNGFSGSVQKITIQSGTLLQRTGDMAGRFVAPAGTPPQFLSLPYDKIGQTTKLLQTQQPLQALSGKAAPWFGQIGGGTQYLIIDDRVDRLIRDGAIIILGD